MMHGGRHTKVYDAYFDLPGYKQARRCEILGTPYADVAHIDPSGMGGRESSHVIENLMALDKELHSWTEGVTDLKEWLKENHDAYMETGRTLYERSGLDDDILRRFIKECYHKMSRRW